MLVALQLFPSRVVDGFPGGVHEAEPVREQADGGRMECPAFGIVAGGRGERHIVADLPFG